LCSIVPYFVCQGLFFKNNKYLNFFHEIVYFGLCACLLTYHTWSQFGSRRFEANSGVADCCKYKNIFLTTIHIPSFHKWDKNLNSAGYAKFLYTESHIFKSWELWSNAESSVTETVQAHKYLKHNQDSRNKEILIWNQIRNYLHEAWRFLGRRLLS
jgi:hypothetical protein